MKLLHIQLILGLWILTAPFFIEPGPIASGNDFLVGAMIIGVSIASSLPALRGIKKINTYLGILLFLVPVLLNHNEPMVAASDMFTGAILIVLSFFRDKELSSKERDPIEGTDDSAESYILIQEKEEAKDRSISL